MDTNDCHDWRLVDFIVRLALARMIRKFSMLAEVRYLFYFLSSFSPVADDFPAFIVKPNRVAFSGTRFAFGYGTVCYVDEIVGEMSDRIFQIVWVDLTQL